MWKDFYKLNKEKLLQPPLILWTVLVIGITLGSQFIIRESERVSLLKGIQIAFIYATAITAITVIVSLLAGLYKFHRKRKIFSQPNLIDFFNRNGFTTSLINKDTKLFFTEEVKAGMVSGVFVIVDILEDQPKLLQFQFHVSSEPINKSEYKELEKLFKQHNAGFEIGYISKKIHKRLPALEIETSLKEFATLLRYEKFFPADRQERIGTT